MKISLKISCVCDTKMCLHAEEEIGDLLQSVYDESYDEGWDAAFVMLKATLEANGIKTPEVTPSPPPRAKRKAKPTNELVN
jgi:hypothetical protein